ncbi:hypothetical protein JY97_03445 [Alkalispirochaeta odontotermitis]|nr:hypothetical protein JY97_03445 [Alkalispirochaeta odontotermitis]CAB1077154.1 hypothetical protein D1AOALGA4SA_4947 [Olavius algarvensis Delta 1 endosymbiont]
MAEKSRAIVIEKDKAVFWLDENGCWHNETGKFRHPKIIQHFHACIKRDRQGYYLGQKNGKITEKVYFPYEDQALFVFNVIFQNDVTLVLNTKKQVKLKPRKLFIKNDCLYMNMGEEIIKFAEQGLMKIARLLEEENDRLFIRVKKRRYQIPAIDDVSASS